MLISQLQISTAVEAKLAEHAVRAREVRQIFLNPRRIRANPRRPGRIEIIGRTNGGRALVVALDPTDDDTVWQLVTSYDAPERLKALIP